MKLLVIGATGYIAGRLIPLLLEKSYSVSVLARNPERIKGQFWANKLDQIIKGNLLNKKTSWTNAIKNFDLAYYLVHSLYAGKDFYDLDKKCAKNFAEAAQAIKHVIYLGGLIPKHGTISEHLKSRQETGAILNSYLPLTEFRAGPIIGSGSAPFEMVRYLTERIPIMVTPKWITNKVQPIAIRDVLNYLLQAAEKEPLGIVEIGSNRISFQDMMKQYAKARNLKRIIIPLPILTPTLSARWVGLITPIPNSLAVPLIEGVIHPVIADTSKAKKYFPNIKPITYSKAVNLALGKIREKLIQTHWTSEIAQGPSHKLKDFEGLIEEQQVLRSSASPQAVFKSFTDIGGEKGWPTMNWAWRIRGLIDKILGGPGLIRGKSSEKKLLVGDVVDFWRVEKIKEGEELILKAEMKLPGNAWLRFHVFPYQNGSILVQTAFFQPLGFWGMIYWYALYPIHKIIFPRMINSIIQQAERKSQSTRT